MSSKSISMRTDNEGLTVKINLFSLAEYLNDFNTMRARLWMKGQVTNAETKETAMFNDAGELITILGRWNTNKFKQLRDKPRK